MLHEHLDTPDVVPDAKRNYRIVPVAGRGFPHDFDMRVAKRKNDLPADESVMALRPVFPDHFAHGTLPDVEILFRKVRQSAFSEGFREFDAENGSVKNINQRIAYPSQE
jgi:hypothetical protein